MLTKYPRPISDYQKLAGYESDRMIGMDCLQKVPAKLFLKEEARKAGGAVDAESATGERTA
jgi:hypothetical protein